MIASASPLRAAANINDIFSMFRCCQVGAASRMAADQSPYNGTGYGYEEAAPRKRRGPQPGIS